MWNNFKQWTMLTILNLNLLQIGRIRVQGHNLCHGTFSDAFASIIFWTYLRPFFFSDAFASIFFYQIAIWTTQFQPVYICVQITPSLWFWCLFVLQHLKFNQDLFVKLSYVCYSNGRVFFTSERAPTKKAAFWVFKGPPKGRERNHGRSHTVKDLRVHKENTRANFIYVSPCTRHVDVMTFQEVG